MNGIGQAVCAIAREPTSPLEAQDELFVSLPDVLDTKGAAKALSIPEQTLRDLARSGEITGFKVGKNWRYSRLRILEYVERQEAALSGRKQL